MTVECNNVGKSALGFPGAGIYFAPIRHHSPVCARALEAMIAEVAPRQILIEAPRDFESMIPILVDSETRPPVAIVTLETESKSRRKAEPGTDELVGAQQTPRMLSYFPLCAYSPEYVGLRAGAKAEARLAFIDLPSGDRLLQLCGSDDSPSRSLIEERRLQASDYVKALCRSTGCRDHNEVWDHLFEQRLSVAPWREVFGAVAAYCSAIRATIQKDELEADGTLAREEAMTNAIAAALRRAERPLIVVTGGFHTPALSAAISGEIGVTAPARSRARMRSALPALATRSYVVRYGFRELDRLNGYAAGMPSPGYYQRLWEHTASTGLRGAAAGRHQYAADCLSGFASHLKTARPNLAPPLPALANALEHAVRLAELRGTSCPGRQDLIDAVTACFVKGELVAGAAPILDELSRFLTGDSIGDVPPSAGSPPLVENVRTTAKRLGFDLDTGSRRKRELDIYRNDRHLAASRFLAAMAFLETGFANRVSGPDFLAGHSRDILIETWQVAWSPMVEARLVALSIHGDELAGVLTARLHEAIAAILQSSEGRSTIAGVRLLMTTCLIGMQEQVTPVMRMIDQQLQDDADLAAVAHALSELFLMWRSRGFLGLGQSSRLEELVGIAYRRALALLEAIPATRTERLGDVLGGMATLREVIVSAADETSAVDAESFDACISRLVDQSMAPLLAGAVAALSYLAGKHDADFLVARMGGHLRGAYTDPADKVGALQGMIGMTRELLWRVPGLLEALDQTVGSMDEERFVSALPHLRLTFAALNPRETDVVAQMIAAARGATAVPVDVNYDIGESEVAANLAADIEICRWLDDDGLGHWRRARAEGNR